MRCLSVLEIEVEIERSDRMTITHPEMIGVGYYIASYIVKYAIYFAASLVSRTYFLIFSCKSLSFRCLGISSERENMRRGIIEFDPRSKSAQSILEQLNSTT